MDNKFKRNEFLAPEGEQLSDPFDSVEREDAKKFALYFKDIFDWLGLESENSEIIDCLLRSHSPYVHGSSSIIDVLVLSSKKPTCRLSYLANEEFMKCRNWSELNSKEKGQEEVTKILIKKIGKEKFEKFKKMATGEKSCSKRNLLQLLVQAIDPTGSKDCLEDAQFVDMSKHDSFMGICKDAEKHFFTYIIGDHLSQDSGCMFLILGKDKKPLMIMKSQLSGENFSYGALGENFSCLSLKPINVGGVFIPAGAIMQAFPKNEKNFKPEAKFFRGAINALANIEDFYGFIPRRMSPFSIDDHKERIDLAGNYCPDYKFDGKYGPVYVNYNWITLDVLYNYACYRNQIMGGV